MEFEIGFFSQLVDRVADRYEQERKRSVPPAWRYQLVENARRHQDALASWVLKNPITPDEIAKRLFEQFDDAWELVNARSSTERVAYLEGGEAAINESVHRNCRFVFWCWGSQNVTRYTI